MCMFVVIVQVHKMTAALFVPHSAQCVTLTVFVFWHMKWSVTLAYSGLISIFVLF